MSCNLEEEELLFRRTFAPSNFRHCVTFVPRDRTFEELLHPETFVPVELAFLENKYCKNLRSKRQKSSKTLMINVILAIIGLMRWFLATTISVGIVVLAQSY